MSLTKNLTICVCLALMSSFRLTCGSHFRLCCPSFFFFSRAWHSLGEVVVGWLFVVHVLVRVLVLAAAAAAAAATRTAT